jgi:hypothetical protein
MIRGKRGYLRKVYRLLTQGNLISSILQARSPDHVRITFDMDVLDRIYNGYAAFTEHIYGNAPWTYHPYHFAPPIQPAGILLPAPQDPPFPPAVFINKQQLGDWIKGALVTFFVIVVLCMSGPLLIIVLLVLGAGLVYKLLDWNTQVAIHQQNERWRNEGRLLPVQPTPQHYIMHPF